MDAMLEQIVELADTPPADVIISSDHQRAMAMTEDDANTQATDLRDKAPAPLDKGADDDDMSALTGSTRTSKADRIADERLAIVHKDHLLALAEAKKEKQLMQEDFERRLAALSATTNVNTSANTLTPESATLPASDNTETKSTPTRNIQHDLSEDEHVGGKEPTELQGSESELSDGMSNSKPTGLQSNESEEGLTVGNSGPSSSDDNSSDEDDTDADRAPTPDEYNVPNKPHQKPVATTRRVVTRIDSSDGNSDGDDEDSSNGKYDNVDADSDDIGSFSDQVEYVGTTAPKNCEDSDSSNGDWSSKFDDLQVKVVANVSKSTKGTTLALAQKQTKKLNLSDLEDSSDDSILKPGSSPDRFRKNKNLRLTFPSRAMIPDSQRTKTFSEPSKAPDPDELAKSNKRYSLRSRAATTTGAPDGGCSP